MKPLEPGMNLALTIDRLQRILRLDTSVFDEVRDDPTATVPAILVVAVSTLLGGLGGWLWWLINDFEQIKGATDVLVQSVIVGGFLSVALWIVWLLIAWVILTQLFREEADWQQMLRTMGMAAMPLALSILMFIPGVDFGIALASIALFFGLTTIAIQAVTPANPARVLIANLAGFLVWAVFLGLFATSDSLLAPGIFLTDAASEALDEIFGAFP